MSAAGIASGAAEIFGNFLSFAGANSANSSNERIARENRAFQERMSSTAHQREVKDLVAANLNPVLSATGGSGASTPAGATATMQNAKASFGNLGSQVNSAAMLRAQIDNLNADTFQKNSNTALQRANTPASSGTPDELLNDFQSQLRSNSRAAAQQVGLNSAQLNNLGAQLNNLRAALPGIEATSRESASSAAVADKLNAIKVQTAGIAKILAESQIPEARATARLFEIIGSAGTGQVGSAAKVALMALTQLIGKRGPPSIPSINSPGRYQ